MHILKGAYTKCKHVSTSVTVGMRSAEGAEAGVGDLEQAGNAFIEAAEDTEVVDSQDTEELVDMVRELEITEFFNVSACIYLLYSHTIRLIA